MTKKVAKRSWSIEKFNAAVKNGCDRVGAKFQATKAKKAYDDGWTVQYTVSQMANARVAVKAPQKKAA
jgi:hypothetical protein